MPAVTKPAHQKGDYLVDYEEKVFRGRQGRAGREGARHLPHRRLRRIDRLRQHAAGDAPAAQRLRDLGSALRPRRHARRTARLSRRSATRPFPGHQNFNNQIAKFMAEGGKVYACRFALQALYGHGEPSLIPGITPDQPARRARPRSCSTARTTPSCSTPGQSEVRTHEIAADRPRSHDERRRTTWREGFGPGRGGADRARSRHAGRHRSNGARPRSPRRRTRARELVVFPETFVPWYPYFSFVLPPVLTGAEHIRLYENAVTVPGPVTEAVAAAARAHGIVVALGVNERDHGSLYNTQLIFDADGTPRAQAPQDHADLPRADDLGPGRRLGPAGRRHRRRPRRRARLLGALQSARPLRADGAARGNPRRAVSGLAWSARSSPSRSR